MLLLLLVQPACATFSPTARSEDPTGDIEVGQVVRLHLNTGPIVQFEVEFVDSERIRGEGVEVLRREVYRAERRKLSVLRTLGAGVVTAFGVVAGLGLLAALLIVGEGV
ncbi:MAG: hypothetical protein AAF389_04660 [Gemmatimonadota bacterium]